MAAPNVTTANRFDNHGVEPSKTPLWGTQVNVPQGANTPPPNPHVTFNDGNNGNGNQTQGDQNGQGQNGQGQNGQGQNGQNQSQNQNGNANQGHNQNNGQNQTGTNGNQTQNGDQNQTINVSAPTVYLPDGTSVPADQYFAKDISQIAAAQEELKGYFAALKDMGVTATGQGQGEGQGEGETSTPTGRQPITFSEDSEVEENERMIANAYNELLEDYTKNNTEWQTKFEAQQKELKGLKDVVGDQMFESAMMRVTATTGLTREEILEANRQTQITDPDVLATLILGQRARKDQETKIMEEAEKARANNGVNGQSQGGGVNTTHTGNEQEPGRGIQLEPGQKLTPEMVAEKYNFMPNLVSQAA